MKLNPSFIKNIHATYGQEGITWLSNLSSHLKTLSAQWNLKILHPVKDISYNFVAVVQWQSRLAILKTAPAAAQLMAEAEWLDAHTKSVPSIFHLDKKNNAYLMEKFEPGTSLKHFVKEGHDEKATRIIAQVILDLQSADTLHQKMNYQHISEHISAFAFLRGHLDTHVIEHAESIFKELCADCSHDIILHGDLHHDNILQSGTSWCVIDPHGYIGNPCAEIGPMVFNPLDCFPKHSLKNTVEARLNILAEMLPFDLQHIKAWAFCLALRSAAWDIEGFNSPNKHTIEIARILHETI